MKLTAAVIAATLALSAVSYAATVDPLVDKTEPVNTPAGGNAAADITVTTAVGVAIGIGVIAAVAGGGGDNNDVAATATATSTGTN